MPVEKFGSVCGNISHIRLGIMPGGILFAMGVFTETEVVDGKAPLAPRWNGWKSRLIFLICPIGNSHFLITMRPTLTLSAQTADLMK